MITPDDQIKTYAECIEIEAFKNFCLPYKGVLPFDGNFYYEEFSPKCVIILSATDIMLGNRVIGAGLDDEITDDMIKEFALFYRKAKRPGFTIQTSPLVLNNKVKAILAENKFVHTGNWAKFAKPVAEIKIETIQEINGVLIEESDKKDIEELSKILMDSFGFPAELISICEALHNASGWTNFTGFLNNKISGSASVFIKGEHAELGAAATSESARGKGIQTALIKAREIFAVRNGCKYIFVETAEPTPEFRAPSYRNMVKSGYTELYRRPNYTFKF